MIADQLWYGGVIDEARSGVRCDCGFVAVDPWLRDWLRPGLHVLGSLGDLLTINLDSMDIIGQRVISIGRTRGVQRGSITAYAYEVVDEETSLYTDLLIMGEDGVFAMWGDSGKLIVTDDALHRPVALLWGGWQQRLREGHEQELSNYGIDLAKVLDLMGLELLTG